MTNIESRLVDDASALEQITLSEAGKEEFRQALAHARQDTALAPAANGEHRGWWLSGLVVASLVAAFLMFADAPSPDTSATPMAEQMTPMSVEQMRPLRPLAEFTRLEQVSHAAALEEEWVNIQKDLAQARETIEAELPIRF